MPNLVFGRIPFKRAAVFTFSAIFQHFGIAQTEVGTLPTVVVTATRSEMDASNAPAAVSVVGSSAIEARNVSRVSDALGGAVPSLYLGASANGQMPSFTGNFSLRGMDASRTLVVIDGFQPLQNGNSQRVNWLALPVDDIERVEVVPGAFSSLYGSNALGGVINVISKSPKQREFTVRLKKGFNDAAGEDASVYFRDTLDSGLGVVAGINRVRREGYVSDYAVMTPSAGAAGTPVSGALASTTTAGANAYVVGDRGKQPWQQDNAFFRLSYDLSGGRVYGGFSQADAQANFSRFNTYLTNGATGAPVSSGTLGINGQKVVLAETNFLGNAPLIDSSKRIFGGYETRIGKDGVLKLDVARTDRENRFPSAGTGATWSAGAGTLTSAPDTSVDGSAVLNFSLTERQFMTVGVAAHGDSVKRTRSNLSNWRDAETSIGTVDRYNGQSSTNSVFAQNEITASEKLTLFVGGRWDQWETSGDFLSAAAPSTSASYANRGQTTFNPKVSGVFKPLESLTLRTSFGTSFRAPTIFEMYSISKTSAGVVTQGDANLRPETGRSWEFGGEWRIVKNFRANATYYETTLDDMIYIQTLSSTLKQRMNAGKTQVRGLEVGLFNKPVSWLELSAIFAWTNSLMLENKADPSSVGKQLTDVPDRTAALAATVMHGPWSGMLEARYVGKVYSTAANTDTAVGVFGAYDAYTVINAKAGYQVNRAARVNVAINNVADVHAFQYSLMPARNATVELVMSF